MSSLTTLRLGNASLLYRAEPESGEDPFAVKLLRPPAGAGRPDEVGLWEEFSATGGVQPLLFSGVTDEGRPYAVTEYRPGGDYGEALAHGEHLPVDEVLAVGAAVAGALAAIHGAGFLHHAVRPENILRGDPGPTLIDFGSALPLDHPFPPVYYTRRDLDHAPPEELRGEAPSPASDVYRLASTMWALLAGHAPFDGEREESAPLAHYRARILGSQVPALPREDVPGWLEAVLRRALAADPQRRTATAEEFAAALAAREEPSGETGEAGTDRAFAVPAEETGEAEADDGYTDGPEEAADAVALPTGGPLPPEAEQAQEPHSAPEDDGYPDDPAGEAETALLPAEETTREEAAGTRAAHSDPAAVTGATEEVPEPPAPAAGAGPEPGSGSDDGYPDDGYTDDGRPDDDADTRADTDLSGDGPSGEFDLSAVGPPRALGTPRTAHRGDDNADPAPEDGHGRAHAPEPGTAPTPSGAAVGTPRPPRPAPLPQPVTQATAPVPPAPAPTAQAAPAQGPRASGVRPGEAAGPGVRAPVPAPAPRDPERSTSGTPATPAPLPAPSMAAPPRPVSAPAPPFDTADRDRLPRQHPAWGDPPARERGIGALVGPALLGLLVVVVVVAGVAVLLRGFGGPDSPSAPPQADGTTDTSDRTGTGPGSGSGTGTEAAEPPAAADPAAELAPTDIGLTDDLVAVSLAWTDNTGGESRHVVVGGPADARGTSMARTEAGESSVEISGLNPEVEYCFQVVAVHSTEVLAPSEEVCTDRAAGDGG
ncbi:protein kinase domain-containing protein [Nocardiopsis dassonvillei]|uniref:protein kinase domain-containing protein n=1 Tax=Nocardiopsis dassonvillei TaxID=2014 RepID=UPI003F568136